MSLEKPSLLPRMRGFPRVSGDEPATSQAAINQVAFSPRERG